MQEHLCGGCSAEAEIGSTRAEVRSANVRRRLPGEVGDELFDSLVVEKHWHPAWPEEDRHPAAEDQRPWMIDLEPRAAPRERCWNAPRV